MIQCLQYKMAKILNIISQIIKVDMYFKNLFQVDRVELYSTNNKAK